MTPEQSFGRFVRQRRRELDLTQEELARRVGCAAITIRKIEADDARPSVQIAERLAMALAIPLDDRAEFVRRARAARPEAPLPSATPMPAPDEIGHEDLTGRAIRGYALAEKIGAGGMGAVYRAMQPLVEREVAIKIILPAFANHSDFIRRFEAEAQLVARLEHPHIVPLYDYWREPGVAYLVMRLLRGGSVHGLVQSGPLALETVAHLLEQICQALHAAHRIGIIHRDLKPGNVLLDEDQNAYLADFGIAKNLGNPNLEEVTQVDAMVGSPAYISPEQIRSLSVRPQTDIYCLGVMLYEMLTGALPFSGPTPFDLIQQHIAAPLPPLAAHRPGLPAALDAVIARAAAKDPDDRYPDVLALLDDFRHRLRNGAPVSPIFMPTEEEEMGEVVNPYKGLRAFSEADADDFFGRAIVIQQLLARLSEGGELARFLAVVGPSGSGKSSVVRAGLISALRRGGLLGSENWFYVDLFPGSHPFEELEAALLRVAVNPPASLLEQLKSDARGLLRAVNRILPADDGRDSAPVELVLVIDQFEELFTLVDDESERALLLNSLVAAVMDERSRVRVVLTLRADFTDRPLRYVDFGELLQRRNELILPLTPDELERAIVGPARRVGLKMEPGLVSAIIRDVGDQPGALPLLQYALTELFERREGHTLTKAAYAEIGGVLGALGRRAEEVFASLEADGQALARQLFLRLVTLSEGAEDTRRRVLRSELESLTTKSAKPHGEKLGDLRVLSGLMEALGKHRLLSFDRDPITRGPTVEVAHEALLREWPRLREWLNESRADVRLQRQLAQAAHEWQSAAREGSFLLTGARLEQFEGWAANTSMALTSDEHAFLDASIAERDRSEAEERERQGRELEAARKLAETERARADEQVQYVARVRTRNRVIAGAGAVALALAALAGMFGLQSSQNATRAELNLEAAQIANTQSAASAATAQAASLLADEQRDVALNAEAAAQTERDRADEAAAIAFSRELAVQAKLNLTVDPERSILLALAAFDQGYSQEAENVLHEAVFTSRLRLAIRGHAGPVYGVAYSPDGKLIASAGEDGTARLWDAATGNELLTLPHPVAVSAVSFSPDGARLATSAPDGLVRFWDATSGQELLTIAAVKNIIAPLSPFFKIMEFSPDGKFLATLDDDESQVRFWDPISGIELFTLSNPDWFAVAPGTDLFPSNIVFSSDGTRLAIILNSYGAGLGRIEIWDMTTRQRVQTLNGRFDLDFGVAFNPDGTRLTTGYGPGFSNATIWDVSSGGILFSLNQTANDIKYSSDGKRLLAAGGGGIAYVFDAETGVQLLRLAGHAGRVFSVTESPGCVQPPNAPLEWCGTQLASFGDEGTIRVWDLSPAGNQEVLTLPGDFFALNADGTRLSTINFSQDLPVPGGSIAIQQWDMPAGAHPAQTSGYTASSIRLGEGFQHAWVFPGDGILAAGFDNGPLMFWDLTKGGEALYPISCCTWTKGMALSISSRSEPRAAIGDPQIGSVTIWDLLANAKIQTLQVAEPHDLVDSSEFLSGLVSDGHNPILLSPDGERLAVLKNDTVEIWDVKTGEKILTPPGPIIAAANLANANLWFSPDGKWLVISACTGTAVLLDAASGAEIRRFSGNVGCLRGVAFSPDGKLLAVNNNRRGLKIWDIETGQELLTLPGGYDVRFTPDGTRVIVANIDEQRRQFVRVYLLRLEDIVALARSRLTRSFTTAECQQYLHVAACP